ncbi:hypothetical protein [Fimbriiglobus ruber]|uniref:Uncharacterized protein n=1 Tax=Fimbriiglobus ruber TaxID=1908690 RepID=A0A225E0H2_9BACT|nr:hypothetical protein [Fimbriiglobus ruber]OWK45304.1 hypothetical protein FRUB_01635 [Fimbriiglobus ruber]
MRQDKDRSGKWLLTHHGDAILKLAGLDGFTTWRPLQPETVAPRRLADGLLEVRFPGEDQPTLVLVEIETYPSSDADRQVLEDLFLINLVRGVVPDVVMLVLRPKGNVEVSGVAERVSRRATARLAGSWRVTRLWELNADDLLATGDAGLVPWVPLARSGDPPEDVLRRCKDALDRVTEKRDYQGLSAVTRILAGLAYPGHKMLDLFGEERAMIESPVLDEAYALMRKLAKEEAEAYIRESIREGVREGLEKQQKDFEKLHKQMEEEFLKKAQRVEEARKAEEAWMKTLGVLREVVVETLATRFPAESGLSVELEGVADEVRLQALLRTALSCPDVQTFRAELSKPTP